MKTLEQQFAAAVYPRVKAYAEKHQNSDEAKKRYGAMAQKLPVLIRTAGLAQALAFVEAKANGSNEDPYHKLLDDLAIVLDFNSGDALLERSREAGMDEYIHLTRRALLALTWFKRFSQSILKVDATEGRKLE